MTQKRVRRGISYLASAAVANEHKLESWGARLCFSHGELENVGCEVGGVGVVAAVVESGLQSLLVVYDGKISAPPTQRPVLSTMGTTQPTCALNLICRNVQTSRQNSLNARLLLKRQTVGSLPQRFCQGPQGDGRDE
jgi:hypothetical protein